MKTIKFLFITFTGTLLLNSCSSDDSDPEVINEEELINRVMLTLTEEGTGATEEYVWNEGADTPVITVNSGTAYTAEVGFYDASNPSDVENITEEVIEEADEHLVFYETANAGLSITNAAVDFEDTAGNPLGIRTTWMGTGTTAGIVRVYLIHEPQTKTGDQRADFGGETDVQVDFNVVIN